MKGSRRRREDDDDEERKKEKEKKNKCAYGIYFGSELPASLCPPSSTESKLYVIISAPVPTPMDYC